MREFESCWRRNRLIGTAEKTLMPVHVDARRVSIPLVEVKERQQLRD